MGSRLLYRDSHGRDGEVPLTADTPCYIGRALDCAIRTDDAMVSRKHSMVRMVGGKFVVEDLGSSNGTHVNDVRVTRQELNHNDVVRCGSLWLRFVEDAGAAQAAQPAQPAPKKRGTRRLDVGSEPAASGNGAAMGSQPAAAPAYTAQPAGGQSYPQPQPAPQPAPAAPQAPPMPGPTGGGGHAARIRDAEERFDALQNKYDREVADGKRMRAEISTLRDRLEEQKRVLADAEEQAEAHERVADELRAEIRSAKEEVVASRDQMGELGESVAARERQLSRAQDDIGKLKDEIEDRDRRLAELSRTKDEGWKKLNEQLAEIEHFREVITEQERMLEERRVGLISQEEVIKELRAEKEARFKEVASLRAERDEVVTDQGRIKAQLTAIDDENRRLTQLLAEAQGGGGGGEQTAKIAGELKELRVELMTVESDRDRAMDLHKRTESEIDQLQERVAKLEVDLREARDDRDKAASAKGVAEEALAKAEVARHKLAEEALAAAKARDVAMSSTEDLRSELSREKRSVERLEKQLADSAGSTETTGTDSVADPAEVAALRDKLAAAGATIKDLERRVHSLGDDLAAAREQAAAAPAASPAPAAPDGTVVDESEKTAVTDLGPAKIMDKAVEVHDSINDSLSELRSNIMLLQGEFDGVSGEVSAESARIIKDTLESLLGTAEDAKGVLRGLKELVAFGS